MRRMASSASVGRGADVRVIWAQSIYDKLRRVNEDLRTYTSGIITGFSAPTPTRVSAANEPRDRSEPTKRRARTRVGESEGRSPSVLEDRWLTQARTPK